MSATTDPERWERKQNLLATLLEAAPEDRERLLAQLEADDPALVGELRALLGLEAEADRFFDASAPALGRQLQGPTVLGQRIRGYRILKQLDHGGMGDVYLAARESEFEQLVAIKFVRQGLASTDLVRRFENERQILASLDHTYVARLLDGGSTDDGQPFLVMEYIEGPSIDRFVEEKGLGTRERVRLFLKVCLAVEELHRKLIVHRDLKPSNILVPENGEPKLLDFGIAKLLAPRPGVHPGLTERGTLLPMTLRYASPEQVAEEAIATSSDVYSLGVVLAQLLTGRIPYHADPEKRGELMRAILAQPPLPPSATLPPESNGCWPWLRLLRRASTTPTRRDVRGDLDSIVLKTLEKKPEQRYSSVEQLRGDLERYLTGHPVQVRKGDRVYRLGKLIRRRKGAAAALAAILGLLMVALAQWRQATIEGERAEAIGTIFERLVREAQPDRTRGTNPSLKEVLVNQSQELLKEVTNAKSFNADLASTLGETYRKFGLYKESRDFFELAVALWRKELGGSDNPDLAKDLNNLGGAWFSLGDYQQAERQFHESLEMRRRLGVPPATLVPTLNNLAAIYNTQGQLTRAEAIYRETLGIRRLELGEDAPEYGVCLFNLGVVAFNAGRYSDAENLLGHSLEVYQKSLEPDDDRVGNSTSTLGRVYLAQGRLREAEGVFRSLLVDRRKRHGENHPDVALTQRDLAAVLVKQNRVGEALSLATQAHGLLTTIQSTPFQLASSESVLGECLVRLGRFEDAEPWLLRSWEVITAERSAHSVYSREALRRLIELYDGWGKTEQAAMYRARLPS